jgi:hypothetical protein
MRRGVPFVIVTGYGSGSLPSKFARVPILTKSALKLIWTQQLLPDAASHLGLHDRSSLSAGTPLALARSTVEIAS